MTSGTSQAAAPQVQIDRLVLDIPGLDLAQARAVALGIGEGLANAGFKPGAGGDRAMVSVPLVFAVGAPPADLAARIVAALIERLA
jgi:hypothetical protein